MLVLFEFVGCCFEEWLNDELCCVVCDDVGRIVVFD